MRTLTSPGQQADFLDGEVLVAEMTSPDWVPAMRRASALITDGGGVTCHAAIVSRELRLHLRSRHRQRHYELAHRTRSHRRRSYRQRSTPAPRLITVQRPSQPLPEPVSHWRLGCTSIWPSPSVPTRSLRCRWTVWACCELPGVLSLHPPTGSVQPRAGPTRPRRRFHPQPPSHDPLCPYRLGA